MTIRYAFAAALFAAAATYTATCSADAQTGPIRGVAFNQLNVNIGGASGSINGSADGNPNNTNGNRNGLYYVLDNQDDNDPATNQVVGEAIRSQIDNLLDAYENAGINTIRLVISGTFIQNYCAGPGLKAAANPNFTDSYCHTFSYPGTLDPVTQVASNQKFFDAVNSLLAKFNSGSHAGQFKVDITTTGIGTAKILAGGQRLVNYACESLGGLGDTDNAGFDPNCGDLGDSANPPYDVPFGNLEEYLNSWFAKVIAPNQAQIALVEIGATLRMCQVTTCDGDSAATDQEVNNGEYIKIVWAWEQANIKPQYPSVAVSYETEAQRPNGTAGAIPDPSQVAAIVHWSNSNTPGLPYNSMSIYLAETHGTTTAQYESSANDLLSAYYGAAGSVPLWLDESGATVTYIPPGATPPSDTHDSNDAKSLLDGLLTATTCQAGLGKDIPKIIWIGTDDLNTNQLDSDPSKTQELFRLIQGYDADNIPMPLPQWNKVSRWYWAQDQTSAGDGYVATKKGTAISDQLSSCGISTGVPTFQVVTAPSHGTVTITNTATGAFTYTPHASFWGNDSFVFANGVGPLGVPSNSWTESIYVYNPAIMSVLIN
ncbi:MAG TPA: Ig-like domain-containing protein [Gammaproteobacteria bacterium]